MIKKDFIIEITRVDFDSKKDMEILGYKQDYINSPLFSEAKVRLNYVMLKYKSFDDYLAEIKQYIDKYPNIKTISLKTLNLNTLNGKIDNPYSRWITDNALTKDDAPKVIETKEVTEEYTNDGEKDVLTKKKICKYYVPADISAAKLLLDVCGTSQQKSYYGMSDEEFYS
mgnify:CR=1 FL=1